MPSHFLGICLSSLAASAFALSIEAREVKYTIEEAEGRGIDVVLQLENRKCRYGPSIEISSPRELDGQGLLSAYLIYDDDSASVIFLQNGTEGRICPNRWDAELVLEYGGGPSEAVFLRILIELPSMDPPYKSLKYLPALTGLHRTHLHAPLS